MNPTCASPGALGLHGALAAARGQGCSGRGCWKRDLLAADGAGTAAGVLLKQPEVKAALGKYVPEKRGLQGSKEKKVCLCL